MTVAGKNGVDMEECFTSGQLFTLHGLIPKDFLNLFIIGFSQASVGVNQTQRLDEQTLNIAYTIREAEKKNGGKKAVIQPSDTACEEWANRTARYAYMLATTANCTPSYFNAEGEADRMTPEQQAGAARLAIWGQGYLAYARTLQEWRAKGGLEGLEVAAA